MINYISNIPLKPKNRLQGHLVTEAFSLLRPFDPEYRSLNGPGPIGPSNQSIRTNNPLVNIADAATRCPTSHRDAFISMTPFGSWILLEAD